MFRHLAPLLLLLSPAAAFAGPSSLSLGEAMERAARNNARSEQARARVHAAESAVAGARGSFSPTVDVGASYSVTTNPAQTFAHIVNQSAFEPSLDFNDLPAVDDLNLQATLRVPVWMGGSRAAALRAGKEARSAARAGVEAVEADLQMEVAQLYFSLIKARAFVEAAQAGVEAFEGNVQVAQKLVEQGVLLEQSLLEVEVRLRRAREDLVRAQNGEALLRETLRHLLAQDEAVVIDEVPPELAVPEAAEAVERPHLRLFEHASRRAQAEVERHKAGYFPQVQLFSSVFYDYGFRNDGDNVSYLAGVGIAWRAWDGLSTRSAVQGARAQAAEARAQLDGTRRDLELARARARIALDDARERLEVTAQELDLAERSARLARARFEGGAALTTELVNAETMLTTARVRRAEAQSDRLLAIASLRSSLGLSIVEKESSK